MKLTVSKKRLKENEIFEFCSKHIDSDEPFYAIDNRWFNKWLNFKDSKSSVPPPKIDNTDIE